VELASKTIEPDDIFRIARSLLRETNDNAHAARLVTISHVNVGRWQKGTRFQLNVILLRVMRL